ncbi:hypothetical protein GCM10009601_37310 [Streptomyces thermospinosisporus]|uniref:Phage holin family protein n=2 Tax=Streptomyces thermospinosisporus TaxID=161482 RepID=A0ABN1Z177_9ACTN
MCGGRAVVPSPAISTAHPRRRYAAPPDGYPAAMQRSEHLQHLDKHLVDELTQVARETVRDELRTQARAQRRKAALYAASGAAALYAGAAVALTVGLALALVLPAWAAALITAALLVGAAYALRNAARPGTPGAPGASGSPDRATAKAALAQASAPPPPKVPPVPTAPPTTDVLPPRSDEGQWSEIHRCWKPACSAIRACSISSAGPYCSLERK